MPSKLRSTTYKLTENQIAWLEEQSEKTGLNKVEIVRRALDAYAQAQETREQRRMFTSKQRQEVKIIARRHGMSEAEVVKEIVNTGLIRMSKKPIKAR